MVFKKILFILILPFFLYAQWTDPRPKSIQLWHLNTSFFDSLGNVVRDSVAAIATDEVTVLNDGGLKQKVFATLAALQLAAADSVGSVVFVKDIGAFIYIADTYPEQNGVAYTSSTPGYQWAKLSYHSSYARDLGFVTPELFGVWQDSSLGFVDATLQAAVDGAANGQRLIIPPGTYKIQTTITVGDSIWIDGAYKDGVTIVQTNKNADAFRTVNNKATISNLTIRMPLEEPTTVDTVSAIWLDGGSYPSVFNIYVEGGSDKTYAVRATNTLGLYMHSLYTKEYFGAPYRWYGNGFIFDIDTAGIEFGNSTIQNIHMSFWSDSVTAYEFEGIDDTSGVMLMNVDGLYAITSLPHPNYMSAFKLNSIINCKFAQLDFEGFDTTLILINCDDNNFINLYDFNSTVSLSETNSYGNSFFGIDNANRLNKYSFSSSSRRLSNQTSFYGGSNWLLQDRFLLRYEEEFWGNDISNKWLLSQGTDTLQGGYLRLRTGGNINDSLWMDWGSNYSIHRDFGLYTRIKLRKPVNNFNTMKFGVVDGNFTSSNHGWWVSLAPTDTYWSFHTANGSSVTSTTTTIAKSTSWRTFDIYEHRQEGTIRLYINGQLAATHTTNLPTTTTLRAPTFYLETTTAASHNLDIRYIKIWMGEDES